MEVVVMAVVVVAEDPAPLPAALLSILDDIVASKLTLLAQFWNKVRSGRATKIKSGNRAEDAKNLFLKSLIKRLGLGQLTYRRSWSSSKVKTFIAYRSVTNFFNSSSGFSDFSKLKHLSKNLLKSRPTFS